MSKSEFYNQDFINPRCNSGCKNRCNTECNSGYKNRCNSWRNRGCNQISSNMPTLYNIELDNNQLNTVEKLQYNSNFKQQLNELQYKSSEIQDFTLKYNTEYYIYNYNYTINGKKCCLHTCPQMVSQPCKGDWASVVPYSSVKLNFKLTFKFVNVNDEKYNGSIKLTDKFFIKSNNKYLGMCLPFQNEEYGYFKQLVAEDTYNQYNTNSFMFEPGNNIENIEYAMLDMIYRIKSLNYKNWYIDVKSNGSFTLGCRGEGPVILTDESHGYSEWVIKTSPLIE